MKKTENIINAINTLTTATTIDTIALEAINAATDTTVNVLSKVIDNAEGKSKDKKKSDNASKKQAKSPVENLASRLKRLREEAAAVNNVKYDSKQDGAAIKAYNAIFKKDTPDETIKAIYSTYFAQKAALVNIKDKKAKATKEDALKIAGERDNLFSKNYIINNIKFTRLDDNNDVKIDKMSIKFDANDFAKSIAQIKEACNKSKNFELVIFSDWQVEYTQSVTKTGKAKKSIYENSTSLPLPKNSKGDRHQAFATPHDIIVIDNVYPTHDIIRTHSIYTLATFDFNSNEFEARNKDNASFTISDDNSPVMYEFYLMQITPNAEAFDSVNKQLIDWQDYTAPNSK